jgi:hypothetical protein
MNTFRLTFTSLWLGLSLLALACSSATAQERRDPPKPPPEAYTACQGKAEGDAVTLTMPDGKQLGGTCRTIDGQLAAAPAGGPGGPGGPGGRGAPPPPNR